MPVWLRNLVAMTSNLFLSQYKFISRPLIYFVLLLLQTSQEGFIKNFYSLRIIVCIFSTYFTMHSVVMLYQIKYL